MSYFYPGDRVVHEVVVDGQQAKGTLISLGEGSLGEIRALVAWDGGDETWWNLRQLRHQDEATP